MRTTKSRPISERETNLQYIVKLASSHTGDSDRPLFDMPGKPVILFLEGAIVRKQSTFFLSLSHKFRISDFLRQSRRFHGWGVE